MRQQGPLPVPAIDPDSLRSGQATGARAGPRHAGIIPAVQPMNRVRRLRPGLGALLPFLPPVPAVPPVFIFGDTPVPVRTTPAGRPWYPGGWLAYLFRNPAVS